MIVSPAILDGTFSASVASCAPGNWGAFLVAYSTPLVFPSAWGEILVNIADPNGELLGSPGGMGNPAVIDVRLPSNPDLAGFLFYTQAVSFMGSPCLHCAYECTIGF